jgi:hypothetical protein
VLSERGGRLRAPVIAAAASATPADEMASTEFFATKRRRGALTGVEVPPSGILIKPCRKVFS